MKFPNVAGAPSVSARVAGTVPPTVVVGAGTIGNAWCEMSKNTLPTASTLNRAAAAVTFGSTTRAEPVFGTALARTYGYVMPPAVDRLIFTGEARTGGWSVPATSHVTVCGESA